MVMMSFLPLKAVLGPYCSRHHWLDVKLWGCFCLFIGLGLGLKPCFEASLVQCKEQLTRVCFIQQLSLCLLLQSKITGSTTQALISLCEPGFSLTVL